MKQLFQELKTGQLLVEELPDLNARTGQVLIRTSKTLISKGTEKMLLDFGRANLLGKARQQPDKVRQVLDKVRTDGLGPTLSAVKSKLEAPLAMGYCNAGQVLALGQGVRGLQVGDRVLSNGSHSEQVCIPQNLCVRIPDKVSDLEAPFAVVGSIALQGIRLANPTLGESFVVVGLGLIGLITVQLLRANGCKVLGLDFDEQKLSLAKSFGAETYRVAEGADAVATALHWTRGNGVDGVIIAASTDSSEPMHQAAAMCRKRGRIILVGAVGLQLSRADFYEKELSFQVSCSYGPGRYETNYEDRGLDYPIGFVRWTEQRNFETVLDLMAGGQVNVKPLISACFKFADAADAYQQMLAHSDWLGVVLDYDINATAHPNQNQILPTAVPAKHAQYLASPQARVALLGTGNYGIRMLLPALIKGGAKVIAMASGGSGGAAAHFAQKKTGVELVTTEIDSVITKPETDIVAIATRHDAHGRQTLRALEHGKHVFVEKPMCITRDDLNSIVRQYSQLQTNGGALPVVMVGFNRRFAPQIKKMKSLLDLRALPKNIVITVNAGAVPANNWSQDLNTGGGRIVGEGCHFVDLLRHLVGKPVVDVQATQGLEVGENWVADDKVSFTLGFADGSVGTVHYLSNGSASFPKERIDVFCGGGVLQLDNFRKFRGFGWPGFKSYNLWSQDKGHRACAQAFIEAVKNGGPPPIPFEELVESTSVTFDVVESARARSRILKTKTPADHNANNKSSGALDLRP